MIKRMIVYQNSSLFRIVEYHEYVEMTFAFCKKINLVKNAACGNKDVFVTYK